jgi:glycosyltransferase involved in cell wall biosynthesis
LVREHQCGLVCLPSANSISRAVTEVLGDLDRAKLMGERARRAALRDYSWSAIARQMSETYEKVIKAQRGAS